MSIALPPVYDLTPNADGVYDLPRRGQPTMGFGVALPMLDGHPPAKHPWLTPGIVSIERAITEWSSDPERVFMGTWED